MPAAGHDHSGQAQEQESPARGHGAPERKPRPSPVLGQRRESGSGRQTPPLALPGRLQGPQTKGKSAGRAPAGGGAEGRGRKRRYPQGQPLPKSPLRGTLSNQAFRPSSALSKPSLEASGPPRCNNSGPFLQKPFHFNKHRNFLLGERFANYAQLSSGEAS